MMRAGGFVRGSHFAQSRGLARMASNRMHFGPLRPGCESPKQGRSRRLKMDKPHAKEKTFP